MAGCDREAEQGAGTAGIPVLSSTRPATCLPPGLVSTARPFAALTETRSPFGAVTRPKGLLSRPPLVTVRPRRAVRIRLNACGIAAIRFAAVSAT